MTGSRTDLLTCSFLMRLGIIRASHAGRPPASLARTARGANGNPPPARANRRLDLLVLAAYILLSLALCWPLPARLGSDVAGRYVDARVFQWNNWWVKTALLEGLDLDYTRHIYAPSGVSLVSHNFNWVSSFLSVPLDLALWPARGLQPALSC